ncbi:MAG: preprotein translocase subunit SecY [Firmicutes bacterium]|nr:preprotein translocase subunit SecY [Bacillota bacterium]MDD4262996.1 preprotein translocase subunit SecY [Bacillota bacterium]MDD4693355.1 preprotein translocase subunit SecY [Bacillota bacterium]
MLEALKNALRIPDLRKKILYTFGLLIVFRLGAYVPVPGIDPTIVSLGDGGVLGLMDLFTGGALSNMSIFALNVGPYITASIVLQLLAMVIPQLEELSKDPDGQKKIAQYTRYSAVVLAIIQSLALMAWLNNIQAVKNPGFLSGLTIVISMTAGTMFLIWLGDKITEVGIGNGISLLIVAGILSRLPASLITLVASVGEGGISILEILLIMIFAIAIVAVVVYITEGQRRIPVQYPKKVVGRKVYGGQSTYIPLRVNQAGVMPIIFASSVLGFPITLARFIPALEGIAVFFDKYWGVYALIYAILVVIFTYFYSAVSFNTKDITENIKKYGGFIPGYRPGQPTALFLDRVLGRVTFAGSIFLAFIATLPFILQGITGIKGLDFGGTGLLIVVGVALETIKQIEAQLLMHQYEGFIK